LWILALFVNVYVLSFACSLVFVIYYVSITDVLAVCMSAFCTHQDQ